MPSIPAAKILAPKSPSLNGLTPKDARWLQHAVKTLQDACLDDLTTVPKGELKRDAKHAFHALKDEKRRPGAYRVSVDGRTLLAVLADKRHSDHVVARLYDGDGRALLPSAIDLGPCEMIAGPESFFMEGAGDADLFLPRG